MSNGLNRILTFLAFLVVLGTIGFAVLTLVETMQPILSNISNMGTQIPF